MKGQWEDRPSGPGEGDDLPLSGLLAELLAGAGGGAEQGLPGSELPQADLFNPPAAPGGSAAGAQVAGQGAAAPDALHALSEYGAGAGVERQASASDLLLARLLQETGQPEAAPPPAAAPDEVRVSELPAPPVGPGGARSAGGDEFDAERRAGGAVVLEGAGVAVLPSSAEEPSGGVAASPPAGAAACPAQRENQAVNSPAGEPAELAQAADTGVEPEGAVPATPDATRPAAVNGGGPTGGESSFDQDDFELVDPGAVQRMLDQILSAARTAMSESPASRPPAPAETPAAEPPLPGEEKILAGPGDVPRAVAAARGERIGGAGAAEPAGRPQAGAAERPAPADRGTTPARHPGGRGQHQAGRAGTLPAEPSPLPSMAALMAMGLPERLRARLEAMGGIDTLMTAPAAAAQADAERDRYVVFRVGGESFGLHMSHVREVERVSRVAPVPGAPAFVAGLVNLRGEILPLVDLRVLLLGETAAAPANGKLVVAQASRQDAPVALLVDELGGLAVIEPSGVEAAPETLSPLLAPRVAGAAVHRGRQVLFLDPQALLSGAAFDRAQTAVEG